MINKMITCLHKVVYLNTRFLVKEKFSNDVAIPLEITTI